MRRGGSALAGAANRTTLRSEAVELEPPNFIEEADQTEGWGEQEWDRWQQLQRRFEELGVKRLEKRGAETGGPGMLLAYTESVQSAFYEPEEISEDEPILGALNRLALKLAPPP
jgi:hypothetical protein